MPAARWRSCARPPDAITWRKSSCITSNAPTPARWKRSHETAFHGRLHPAPDRAAHGIARPAHPGHLDPAALAADAADFSRFELEPPPESTTSAADRLLLCGYRP